MDVKNINTLEAVTFGIPVIFGPKYQKFQEAKDLIDLKSGFSINNTEEFKQIFSFFINKIDEKNIFGKNARDYIIKNRR